MGAIKWHPIVHFVAELWGTRSETTDGIDGSPAKRDFGAALPLGAADPAPVETGDRPWVDPFMTFSLLWGDEREVMIDEKTIRVVGTALRT